MPGYFVMCRTVARRGLGILLDGHPDWDLQMVKASTTFLVLLLAGCSPNQRFTDMYAVVGGTPFQHSNLSWVVRDRRDIGSMLIQYDTFGATQRVDIPKQSFDSVAAAYLATVGAGCQVKTGSQVMTLSYEFTYQCGSA